MHALTEPKRGGESRLATLDGCGTAPSHLLGCTKMSHVLPSVSVRVEGILCFEKIGWLLPASFLAELRTQTLRAAAKEAKSSGELRLATLGR